jgi:hypothetical protein
VGGGPADNSAIFQGGFIPDNILYLSYWYNKYDLPVRLAFFWTMLSVVDIVTGFMAVGLLKMRGVLGYEGWRCESSLGSVLTSGMFLIEGIITLLIGSESTLKIWADASRIVLDDACIPSKDQDPVQKERLHYRPRGKDHCEPDDSRRPGQGGSQVESRADSQGEMHNRQALSLSMIWKSFKDYQLWPM